MTTTSKDDELYREVEYCVTMEYKAPNGEPAKSRIDRLMRMFMENRKQYGDQRELEALEWAIQPDGVANLYERVRFKIDKLTTKKEEGPTS